MKAFISCSINETEKYIISILAIELGQKGFVLKSSFNTDHGSEVMADISTNEIINSRLFIGILSSKGNNKTKVLQDYKYARFMRIPSLLLVENNVKFRQDIDKLPNVIRFDRDNPELSIQKVKKIISPDKKRQLKPIAKKNSITKKEEFFDNNDGLALVLGGAALIALIALLSSNDK
ncbi:hypothetical protein [Sporocytophaga myxococcoides]|uniref:hypothetical protein n=1 Tax=Sporocytophaga myxococcoides TaxID=153721 RepID=UPI0003F8EECA|nr:hypothetical protein [Sporocytophaga myxococcoides]